MLEQQVRRMLADPQVRSADRELHRPVAERALAEDQRAGREPVPGFRRQPARTRSSAKSELFFGSIVHEDRSVLDLLTADYTFVNERLAKHYGIPNIYGPQFRRVTLPAELDMRRGLLGKGALLTVTSNAARTSPVTRGKWFLQTFLGVEPAGSAARTWTGAQGEAGGHDRQREGADDAADARSASRATRRARRATRSSSRWASRSRTSTPSAPGAPRTRAARSTPPACWSTAPSSTASASLRDVAGALLRSVRARRRREAADLRARPRRRVSGHAARALDRARRGGRASTGSRRSCWASSRATRSR